LGSRPRQGFVKVRAKSEARESHFMLLGVWECERVWRNEPPHSQVSSHFGSWTPNRLLNLERAIARGQPHLIEEFFITLESSWNLDVQNGFAWFICVIKTQVMAKRRVGNQIANLTFDY
jgi:hypothetical protein